MDDPVSLQRAVEGSDVVFAMTDCKSFKYIYSRCHPILPLLPIFICMKTHAKMQTGKKPLPITKLPKEKPSQTLASQPT